MAFLHQGIERHHVKCVYYVCSATLGFTNLHRHLLTAPGLGFHLYRGLPTWSADLLVKWQLLRSRSAAHQYFRIRIWENGFVRAQVFWALISMLELALVVHQQTHKDGLDLETS